jgi:hypothetical protein
LTSLVNQTMAFSMDYNGWPLASAREQAVVVDSVPDEPARNLHFAFGWRLGVRWR